MDTPPGPRTPHFPQGEAEAERRGLAHTPASLSTPGTSHLPSSSQPRAPRACLTLLSPAQSPLSTHSRRGNTSCAKRKTQGPRCEFCMLASSSQMYSERQQAPSPAREVEWGPWPQPGCDLEVSTCWLCNCMQVCDVSAPLCPLLGHGEE